MRRIVMLLTIALVMTLVGVLSASAAFADPPIKQPEPQFSDQAKCALRNAEEQAPNQADENIPSPIIMTCPE